MIDFFLAVRLSFLLTPATGMLPEGNFIKICAIIIEGSIARPINVAFLIEDVTTSSKCSNFGRKYFHLVTSFSAILLHQYISYHVTCMLMTCDIYYI